MRPQTLYEVLSGQRVTSLLVHDAWHGAPFGDDAGLFGGIVLAFERHSLLIGSPLRYLNNQEGTRYGLSDGSTAMLGFRSLVCESAHADALISLRLGLPSTGYWQTWAVPPTGEPLAGAPQLQLRMPGASACIALDFASRRYCLTYRTDLDGAIQFAPPERICQPEGVTVTDPKGPFGWLHPSRIAGFVLDDQRWRSLAHWPIEVRRRFHSAPRDGPEVRELLKRACLAYFRQNPEMRRRLLALELRLTISGVPAELVDEVRIELLENAVNG